MSENAVVAAEGAAPTAEEKQMSMIAHISGFILFGPAIIMLTKGKESAWVRDQSVEALNFAITGFIAMVAVVIISIVLGIVGATLGTSLFSTVANLLNWAVRVGYGVLLVMAALKANSGVKYRYPFALRLVK